MTAENWAAIITALGLGTILTEVIRAIVRAVSGRVGRERNAVEYERKQADAANKRAEGFQRDVDTEIRKRRVAEARAARYERLLILNGIVPNRDTWTDETTVPTSEREEER